METSRKRKFEKWAGIAYAAGFVISTLHDFYSEDGFFDNSSFYRMKPLQITLTHALVFGHAYFVSKGKVWRASKSVGQSRFRIKNELLRFYPRPTTSSTASHFLMLSSTRAPATNGSSTSGSRR